MRGADRADVRAQDARGATGATTSSRARCGCCPDDAVVVCFEPRALRQVRGLRRLQHVGVGVSIRRAARYAWGVGFWDPRARRARDRARPLAGALKTTVYTVNDEGTDAGARGARRRRDLY